MALFALAGGNHPLPELIFVTTPETLVKLAVDEDELRESLPPDSLRLLALPLGPGGPSQLRDAIRAAVSANLPAHAAGVVLIGDYDTLPALPLAVVDQGSATALAAATAASGQDGDPDGWIVWSDDLYGDLDGDGFPDVPVSRVPRAALWHALQATGTAVSPPRRRSGIRASAFAFADSIYRDAIDGGQGERLFVAPPSDGIRPQRADMKADRLYLALHGTETGPHELSGGSGPALTTSKIPAETGAVVFCGACWGALTVNQTAWSAVDQQLAPKQLQPRVAQPKTGSPVKDRSIALTFLARGATAFVGFTGYHYVPTVDALGYLGSTLHRRFWERLRDFGNPPQPARALFQAKRDYLAEAAMQPGAASDEVTKAIIQKTFWSATCLGLGW